MFRHLKSLIFAALILACMIFAGFEASAQVSAPDYSKWKRTDTTARGNRNGQNYDFAIHTYDNTDEIKGIYLEAVQLLDDENGNRWLMLYLYDSSQSMGVTLFEYKDKDWVRVKDFEISHTLGGEITIFLLSQYKLSFSH